MISSRRRSEGIITHATMPEEKPLETLTALILILKSKNVFVVIRLEKIEQLRRCLDDGEWRSFCIVNDYWNSSYINRQCGIHVLTE
jgi:hypothetical protein